MQRSLSAAAVAVAVSCLCGGVAAQNCYESQHQCFTFGPPRGLDVGKLDTDGALELRSQKLSVEGDIRLRVRVAETRMGYPYAEADQQATRARVRMRYQANEHLQALVEFNFSETWAGSASYSDALAGEDFNGVSQFYVLADDLFGAEDKWRIGRSEFILSNGLIIGSCDFLQRPGTFTGVWASRNFGGHDVELFVFDDYGPLQATHPGARYVGGSANIVVGEYCGEIVHAVRPYYFSGTGDGDLAIMDAWLGVDATGSLGSGFGWGGEFANRFVDGGEDRMAWRATLTKTLDWFDGALRSVSLQHTDANGKMDIGNPADFNSAGLLHQYGGAWRSDLQTTQFGVQIVPLENVTLDFNFLTLDRRGTSTQLGDFEVDAIVGAKLASGAYIGGGYGIDNDQRQVGYMQLTVNF